MWRNPTMENTVTHIETNSLQRKTWKKHKKIKGKNEWHTRLGWTFSAAAYLGWACLWGSAYAAHQRSESPTQDLPFFSTGLFQRIRSLRCACQSGQRWNSWTAFLVEVSRNKLEHSQTLVSTLIFPFYKTLFMNSSSFLISRIFL
jgi:hypothetical protein